MKNKNKPIIDIYDPIIYPILLVVAKYITAEQINKQYSKVDGSDITEEYLGYDFCAITFSAIRRKDNRKCIIVMQSINILKEDDDVIANATHEGGHYVMDMFNSIGCEISAQDQEPFCYLLQWAVTNIYTTLSKKNGNKRKKQKTV